MFGKAVLKHDVCWRLSHNVLDYVQIVADPGRSLHTNVSYVGKGRKTAPLLSIGADILHLRHYMHLKQNCRLDHAHCTLPLCKNRFPAQHSSHTTTMSFSINTCLG